MWFVLIFGIGAAVGYVARRYAFCIFGAVLEFLTLGSWRRAAGVLAAMVVFGTVQMGAYKHGAELPGMVFLVGGLAQGAGYYLAMGCPLSLLVRLGEGSKFHAVVFVSFIVGVALYVLFLGDAVSSTLGQISFSEAQTVQELFRR